MKEFVIRFPSWVLLIIVLFGVLEGGYAIIWMLFGYFLGTRAENISRVGDVLTKHISEKIKREDYKDE